MKIKRFRKKYILTILAFILLLSIILFSVIYFNPNNNVFNKLYYQVTNNYYGSDYEDDEIIEIYNSDDFIANLLSFNDELHKNPKLTFLEYGEQAVEFLGEWNKPKNLANGYGHKNLINQEIDNDIYKGLLTPVNSIQVSESTQDFFKKSWFVDKDFNQIYNNSIPMVLGYGFKEHYNIGDEIEFLFLQEKCIGYVAKFLDEDESLIFDDFTSTEDFSSIVILPYFDELNENNLKYSEHFIRTYNLVKNNSYLFIEDKKDFNKQKRIVEKIARECNVDFTVLKGY